MERLNMNLPSAAKKSLGRLAKAAKRREAEYARDLLVKAIEDAEREALFDQLAVAQTPERRARDRQIALAMEKLRG